MLTFMFVIRPGGSQTRSSHVLCADPLAQQGVIHLRRGSCRLVLSLGPCWPPPLYFRSEKCCFHSARPMYFARARAVGSRTGSFTNAARGRQRGSIRAATKPLLRQQQGLLILFGIPPAFQLLIRMDNSSLLKVWEKYYSTGRHELAVFAYSLVK